MENRDRVFALMAVQPDRINERPMTDNPSSSVPVSKGERTFPIQFERRAKPHPPRIPWSVAELAYSVYAGENGTQQSLDRVAERGGFYPGEMDQFLPDWRERCSALASQEARHHGQLEAVLMDEPWEGRYVHLLLCNGGYQKPGTPGLICNCPIYQRILTSERALRESDARHRQEMEEAHKVNAEAIANQRALSNLEHKTRLELRAAEQREREAGEREKWMYEAVVSHHQAHGCPTVTRVILDAFAAIRCAPSPVPVTLTPLQGEGGQDAQAHDGESETAASQDRGDEAASGGPDGSAGVRARAESEVGHDRPDERLSAAVSPVRDRGKTWAGELNEFERIAEFARSAPSPVSAPPTETPFITDHTYLDPGNTFADGLRANACQHITHSRIGDRICHWGREDHAAASPVEPGSDPQEPETR